MKIRKVIILAIVALFIAILIVGCSSADNKIEIDWETVNKALDEHGYPAKSIKEAEEIIGYPIPAVKQLPPGFKKEAAGILISKLQPKMEDSPLSVWLTWAHEDGYELGSVSLTIDTLKLVKNDKGGYNESDIIEINGSKVYLRTEGTTCTLEWYDEDIHYSLYGMLTDALTEEKYLDMAESIIK